MAQIQPLDKRSTQPKWLPVLWISLGAAILAADYLSGPFISWSILFVIPVALAARFSGGPLGITLGVLMPLAHFGFTFLWPVPWTLLDSVINAGIRTGALVAFAVLIDRITRQAREIRVLRGLLPVCALCKRIRTEDEAWQQIESYIAERSEASFTHTYCPECAKQHYGEWLQQPIRAQGHDSKPGPE